MRVAALYDIHGNLPALEAVLEDVYTAAVDLIVVGGDAVLGPMPRETLEYLASAADPGPVHPGQLRARDAHGDWRGGEPTTVPPAFREIMRWVGDQLLPEQAATIASWPVALQLEIPGLGDVLFCHATPRSDTETFTRHTPEERLFCRCSAARCGRGDLRAHAHAVRPHHGSGARHQRGQRRHAVRRAGRLLARCLVRACSIEGRSSTSPGPRSAFARAAIRRRRSSRA